MKERGERERNRGALQNLSVLLGLMPLQSLRRDPKTAANDDTGMGTSEENSQMVIAGLEDQFQGAMGQGNVPLLVEFTEPRYLEEVTWKLSISISGT